MVFFSFNLILSRLMLSFVYSYRCDLIGRYIVSDVNPFKRQTKIAADDTLIFLLLFFEENKA